MSTKTNKPIDPTAMMLGWLVGKRIAGQRGNKTPVAYLYNGVELPEIPEWDKTVYPYAVILLYENSIGSTVTKGYVSYIFAKPVTFFDSGTLGFYSPYRAYSLKDSNGKITMSPSGKWMLREDVTTTGEWYNVYGIYYTPIWANCDLRMKESGELYLEASDPIPVYE